MFQYAACKTIADKKGFRFCFRGGKKGSLYKFFKLSGESKLFLFLCRLAYNLTPYSRKKLYRPAKSAYTPKKTDEKFDPGLFNIQDGYTVQGMFQSEKYFKDNRTNVLKWFTPRAEYLNIINKIDKEIVAPTQKRCCIHIRRTDYQNMTEKDDGLGWILPIAYYQKAINQLPDDLFYIIISDSPEFAEKVFSCLTHKYISKNQPAIVDMFLLTRCHYNILANSTFSWWGGWLNQNNNKHVIAPKYNLGWIDNIWFPDQIMVDGWNYIDVNKALSEFGNIETIKPENHS